MKKRAFVLSTLFAILIGVVGCVGNTAESSHVSVESSTTTSDSITSDASEIEIAATESADYVIELDPEYNVPTDELLKKFPIKYQTPAETELSQKIQGIDIPGTLRRILF